LKHAEPPEAEVDPKLFYADDPPEHLYDRPRAESIPSAQVMVRREPGSYHSNEGEGRVSTEGGDGVLADARIS
jgi:hypothetical protein